MTQELYDEQYNARKKAFAQTKAANHINALMNTALGVTNALANAPVPFNFVLAGIIGAMGAAQQAIISSAQYTPPQAATGGYIGGNLHSQGGTMIEAERGEFILSRKAVNAVGTDFLHGINNPQNFARDDIASRVNGGGGVINISFEGNVLSDSFIEDEAIPKIREAVRRGEDIGVS